MAVTPVIPTFSNRYNWPESDAEFLHSVIADKKNIEETKNRINSNSTTSDESLSLSTSNRPSSGAVNSIDGSSSSTVGGDSSQGSKNYRSLIMLSQRYMRRRSRKFTKEEDTTDEKNSWVDKIRTPMRSKLRNNKKESISFHRVFYALFKDLVCCMEIKVDDV